MVAVGGHVAGRLAQLALAATRRSRRPRRRRTADEPGEGAQQVALAVAHDPADADDLAAATREGDVGEAVAGEPVDVQDDVAEGVVRAASAGRSASSWRPTIMASSSSSVTSSTRRAAAQPAVAQHGDALGEHPHLGEAVGDVDDGGPRRGQGPHALEEQVDRVGTERRGGLVEDEHPGPYGERLGQLEQVLLGHREAVDPLLEVHPRGRCRRARRACRRARTGRRRSSTSGGRASRRFSATVRSGSTAGCWWTMAMPERVAAAGLSEACCSPSSVRTPASGWMVPGRDAHQRRLPGTVLAEQGVHLAGQHLERDVGERGDTGIALGDVRQHHRRLSHRHCGRLGHVVLHAVGSSGLVTVAGRDGGHPTGHGAHLSSAAWSSGDISAER